ncbi:trehalase-domain-containing protein [Cokeromyces recurvatus]|uniref:trehalase-domain-containing protein n=1 Tax=Cokeromyces recurvatus TaxID=90255 RepID=UPI002220F23B|nr:trehalase-domain-containing protein [Cokeromyces recurvatus]KAI7907544.1 trehalase-domain-containing protein [Cokeromyces recurvatus]
MFNNNRRESVDPTAPPSTYYTTGRNAPKHRTRTYTRNGTSFCSGDTREFLNTGIQRRASYEDRGKSRRFLIDVDATLTHILEQEDTDGDFQITINDLGPKTLSLGTADSGGYKRFQIRGNYMLSNLLQELALAKDFGRKYVVLDEARLNENPVNRLSRMIRHLFWDNLTRTIDGVGLESISADPKNRTRNIAPRIYVPYDETEIYDYYKRVAEARPNLQLDVQYLPKDITPEYVKSINDKPGILALAMKRVVDDRGNVDFQGVPFVVPGGRFNEMYGWDSYFESLGLLVDGRVDLAKGMVENFAYEIKHYGKILNANRSYYLSRSQPPFLTDMAIKVYEHLDPSHEEENKAWLREILKSAIKEYHTVWMAEPRLDKKTMLSRYRPDGIGIPPETEASHFDHIIKKYAEKYNVSIPEFNDMYNQGQLSEPELDEYFLHDRAVRESGHDTTYRFDGICANLATVDLNALLYKYETDIADCIRDILDDELEDFDGNKQTAEEWSDRASLRRKRIDTYLWNEKEDLYFDYDTVKEKMTTYESATAYWPMWAGCASQDQAQRLKKSLYKFEVKGGLVSGTEQSRGPVSIDRPNRQWDFPFGWAPHQIMSWAAFDNYGMSDIAGRLAYRFLYTITKSFVDFNGVVPEKFDVVNLSHQVQVEYGNVGVDFKYVSREGFGWMNASFEVGLSYLDTRLRRALGALTDPDTLFKNMLDKETSKLSEAEKREALSIRRVSTIAAREIIRNESDAVVTRIDTRDMMKQSINSPKSPEIYHNFITSPVDQLKEGDTKLVPVPNYGDYLDASNAPSM